ncbi:MAG TPA: hypothetical protein VFK80_10610 [Limnochordia bacterium]|nr:hypothetical protein [Limnochordia bacterium]
MIKRALLVSLFAAILTLGAAFAGATPPVAGSYSPSQQPTSDATVCDTGDTACQAWFDRLGPIAQLTHQLHQETATPSGVYPDGPPIGSG